MPILLENLEAQEYQRTPDDLPRPLSARDIDLSPFSFDMMEPMADACPRCQGHNMKAGDWCCWGFCYRCYLAEEERNANL